jgi:hypothetical protein
VCEVVYASYPASLKYDLPPHQENLVQHYLDRLNSGKDADVTFRVRGEEIKAHKNILTHRSAYFRLMFESGMKESLFNEVPLDENPAIFKKLLRFIYSGSVPVNIDENAMELLPLADKYGLDDLKPYCEAAICRNVSAENVIEVLRLADMHNCTDLFEYASPIFKENLKGRLEKESKEFLAKLLQICSE